MNAIEAKILNDLNRQYNAVHCLECDDTFEEENGTFVDTCPHCGNTDTERTVYLSHADES